MSNYPYGYPDQRLIVDGVDLTTEFRMILIDGFELQPPEPKVYTVDIPGGNGVIDLTEALGGEVAFKNRKQRFTFKTIYRQDFESVKTHVSNFLHGRYYRYNLTWDYGYEYRGRFSVVSYSHIGLAAGKLGEIVIEVDADPYKYLEDQSYKLAAVGGEMYYFPSGRKPVRPVVQTNRATTFTWKDNTFTVGIGTYRLNDVLFTEGINELYINSYAIFDTKWEDVGKGGSHEMTWDEAKQYTWDKFQMLTLRTIEPNEVSELVPFSTTASIAVVNEGYYESSEESPQYYVKCYQWNDMSNIGYTWQYLKDNEYTWDGLNPDGSEDDGIFVQGDGTIYLTYEWGDL